MFLTFRFCEESIFVTAVFSLPKSPDNIGSVADCRSISCCPNDDLMVMFPYGGTVKKKIIVISISLSLTITHYHSLNRTYFTPFFDNRRSFWPLIQNQEFCRECQFYFAVNFWFCPELFGFAVRYLLLP